MKKKFAFLLAAVAVSVSLSLVGCEIEFNFNTSDPTNEISAFDSSVSVVEDFSADATENSSSVAVSSGDETGNEDNEADTDQKFVSTLYYNAQQWDSVDDSPLPPAAVIKKITAKSDFDLVFVDFPEEVDFEKNMVVTYSFSDFFFSCPYELSDVRIENNSVKIEINRLTVSGIGNMTAPTYHLFAIITKDFGLDAINVEIEDKYVEMEEIREKREDELSKSVLEKDE